MWQLIQKQIEPPLELATKFSHTHVPQMIFRQSENNHWTDHHEKNTGRKVFLIAIRICNLYNYRTAFKFDIFETVILHHNTFPFFVEWPKLNGIF